MDRGTASLPISHDSSGITSVTRKYDDGSWSPYVITPVSIDRGTASLPISHDSSGITSVTRKYDDGSWSPYVYVPVGIDRGIANYPITGTGVIQTIPSSPKRFVWIKDKWIAIE